MTYKELKEQLDNLSEEQLNQDVTVYDSHQDEYYGSYTDLEFTPNDETDVLDPNHAYIVI